MARPDRLHLRNEAERHVEVGKPRGWGVGKSGVGGREGACERGGAPSSRPLVSQVDKAVEHKSVLGQKGLPVHLLSRPLAQVAGAGAAQEGGQRSEARAPGLKRPFQDGHDGHMLVLSGQQGRLEPLARAQPGGVGGWKG